jgi:transcriptional regulator with XRE-family HTH domain
MSFQVSITPSQRAAGRFVARVRRSIQKALAEETQKNGITQSDLARAIGVNRSVISREIRGHKDITLSRVAELAWALGRKPSLELLEPSRTVESNHVPQIDPVKTTDTIKRVDITAPVPPVSSSNDNATSSKALFFEAVS